MTERYLTKSRFKLARECPTKLFYTAKSDIYPDTKNNDSFLQALADGGHQVGELAKHYYPDGIEVKSLGYEKSIKATNELLKQDHVIIYEAALRHDNLFVRVDILLKDGNQIHLIEVKAKSADGDDPAQFLTNKGYIRSNHLPYLEDIAFQKHVAQGALGHRNVTASLMFVNKQACCPTDGLNQKFRTVIDTNGRHGIEVSSKLSAEDLSSQLLVEIKADDLIEKIWKDQATTEPSDSGFIASIEKFASHYVSDTKITTNIGNQCKKCEFRVPQAELEHDQNSGFNECWSQYLDTDELVQPLVLDLWNSRKTEELISKQKYRLIDIDESDLDIKRVEQGMSTTERQFIQVNKTQNEDTSSYVDQSGLENEIETWQFPFNFIDFETSRVAIPFHKGQHPYSQIAFQFSHHILFEDGQIQHASEYLNARPGEFPNYEFVRALKSVLETNQGTVFRYHTHENSVLVGILKELHTDPNRPADANELIAFIQTITSSEKGILKPWCGKRNMVDLQAVIKHFYYNPLTKGSNSLKYVLPAILNSSDYLRDKYSQPIYGTPTMPSRNFTNHAWLKPDEIADPYKALPPVFESEDARQHQEFLQDQDIQQGGAALTAYSYLQFVEMKEEERSRIENALLRYCELDTLAMVIVYEALVDALNSVHERN